MSVTMKAFTWLTLTRKCMVHVFVVIKKTALGTIKL